MKNVEVSKPLSTPSPFYEEILVGMFGAHRPLPTAHCLTRSSPAVQLQTERRADN